MVKLTSSNALICIFIIFITTSVLNLTNSGIQRIDVLIDEDPDYELSQQLMGAATLALIVGLVNLGISILVLHFYSKQREIERLELYKEIRI